MQRKPVIGVMGGSKATPEVCQQAQQLGRLIAEQGWVLLTGGRNSGVMAATTAGAREAIDDGADGMVIGILPDPTTALAAPGLDIAIVTDMGDARNVINVLSSDVVIACPGALGTHNEIVLAVKRKKPVILLGFDVSEDVAKHAKSGDLLRVETPAEAVLQVKNLLKD